MLFLRDSPKPVQIQTMNLKFEFASLTQCCYNSEMLAQLSNLDRVLEFRTHIFSWKIVTTDFPNLGFLLTG